MRRCAECNNWVATFKVKVTLKGQMLKTVHFIIKSLTFTFNDISSLTASSKLHRNVSLVVNFKKYSKNLFTSRTLIAMAIERKNLKYLL
jgi:hypothetical protein